MTALVGKSFLEVLATCGDQAEPKALEIMGELEVYLITVLGKAEADAVVATCFLFVDKSAPFR